MKPTRPPRHDGCIDHPAPYHGVRYLVRDGQGAHLGNYGNPEAADARARYLAATHPGREHTVERVIFRGGWRDPEDVVERGPVACYRVRRARRR